MKILLIADVHNRPLVSRAAHDYTLKRLKKAVARIPCDLIAFLGDMVHGPDFNECNEDYMHYLREVLDIAQGKPFAAVFGNHDDECRISKEEILSVMAEYPNSLTSGRDYVIEMNGECLLFIDSGSYYDGEGSYYDTVKQEQISFALEKIKGKKAILFQHIIVPDIIDCLDEYDSFRPFYPRGDGKWVRFSKGVKHSGFMGERPCPPQINTGELEQLSPYLKGAVFGHDHKNDFELDIRGVRIIQCAGSGSNCYDKLFPSSVKLLDTETMKSRKFYI